MKELLPRAMSLGSKASRDNPEKRTVVVNPSTAPTRTDEIWSIYNREAEVYDRRLVEGWRDDMDGTLIFAGLFSATVTAFIIETYKNLIPDSSETTTTILMQISQQLAAGGNHTTIPAMSGDRIAFQPPSSAVRCNVLLFLSLIFSLFCALAAILVRQWARNYLHGTQRRRTAPVRGLIRSYLHEGIVSFQLKIVVNAIPTLLHIALFLFGGGIYEFFAPIHPTLRNVTFFSLLLGAVFYVGTALMASFCSSSPYQTTLSTIFWYLMLPLCHLFSGLHGRYTSQIEQLEHHSGVHKNPLCRPQIVDRVTKALRWTLQTLDTHEKMEPFIAGIPEFFNSGEVDAPKVMLNLLEERNDDIMSRVRQFLNAVHYKDQSSRLCIAIPAIWSLTYETFGIREGVFSTVNFWECNFRTLKRYLDADDPILASQAQHTVLILLCRSREEDYSGGTWDQWMYPCAEIISTLEKIGLGRDTPVLERSTCTPDDLHIAAFTMLLSALRHGKSFNLPIACDESHPWPSRQNIIPSLIRSLDMSRVCPGLQHYFVETVIDALTAQLKNDEESKVKVDGRLLRLLTTVTDYDTLVAAENLLNNALSYFDSHRSRRNIPLMEKCKPIVIAIRNRLSGQHAPHGLRHGRDSESQEQLERPSSSSMKEEATEMLQMGGAVTPFSVKIERRHTVTFSQDTVLDDGGRHYGALVESEESGLLETESVSGKRPLRSSRKSVTYHRLTS